MSAKKRLDLILVEKGYFDSRQKAQAAILAGQVQLEGTPPLKASTLVPFDCKIQIKEKSKYVSRGREKLEAAFTAFPISVKDKMAVDLGASTGGFTQCLLAHGAKTVYAVDVGKGQLHEKLRQDSRVHSLEKTNARFLTKNHFLDAIEFLTADLSFISLEKVLPAIVSILSHGGDAILLIKPQFEAEKKEVGKGKGVIRSHEIHKRVIEKIKERAIQLHLIPKGVVPSPLLGPAGNQEYLLWVRKEA